MLTVTTVSQYAADTKLSSAFACEIGIRPEQPVGILDGTPSKKS